MGKQTVISGCTVTGNLTLGNYVGAILSWKKMQEECDCFYFIADLHALTIRQKSAQDFHHRCRSFFAQYLSLGLDPEKNTLFVQSQVHEHAELAWLLTCLTPMGHLNRMTQFKEKMQKQVKNINAGLFAYPALMAADILLYRADRVPVGEDQRQHLELCRDLVTFFENAYGKDILVMPAPHVPKTGSKVMSLTHPEQKMSKSDPNEKSYVSLIDSPQSIRKKVKSAVTDSDTTIEYDPEKKPGLANLLTIYSVLSGDGIERIVADYRGKMYGHLKSDLADLIVETLAPHRKEYEKLMDDPGHIETLMEKGRCKAQARAADTLAKVYGSVGLVRR